VVDRSADPVREKCPDPHGCPGRRDRGKHQGVGLDDAGAGGRGWRPDRGPRQDTRRPAARHRRDPGDGRRGLERRSSMRPARLCRAIAAPDMVGASSLACNGDFRLRLPGTSICKEPAGSFQSALVGEDGGGLLPGCEYPGEWKECRRS
jgi:hypothetical protein